ncbi:hypothetical protein [Lacrimispora celerecrescens]|uniref:hypothetical protein n=1 Tax=Lacrimispora celerecrescens TaxID=29354 RepID=UPI0016462DB8|nr:hypothetical protein [Lacrimispora celerecrescens]
MSIQAYSAREPIYAGRISIQVKIWISRVVFPSLMMTAVDELKLAVVCGTLSNIEGWEVTVGTLIFFCRNCIKRFTLVLANPVIIGFSTDSMSGSPIRYFLIACHAFLNPFNPKAEFLGISCYS